MKGVSSLPAADAEADVSTADTEADVSAAPRGDDRTSPCDNISGDNRGDTARCGRQGACHRKPV